MGKDLTDGTVYDELEVWSQSQGLAADAALELYEGGYTSVAFGAHPMFVGWRDTSGLDVCLGKWLVPH